MTAIFQRVKNFRGWLALYFLSATIVTAVYFGWVLVYGYFFSDDFTWIWHGSRIASGELSVWTAKMSSFYSPVLNAFHAYFFALFKRNRSKTRLS
jgi:hypothetical protein